MLIDKKVLNNLLLAIVVLTLASCSFSKRQSGGYYQDDGPGKRRVDISKIPNATPRNEAISRAASRPYKIRGKRYVPLQTAKGFRQEGFASWYGKKYHGRKTSNGEVYDMYAMTAAHTTLPIPSYVRVTNINNQRSVIVRVNDRGPFIDNRIIDLSYVAAKKLGIVSSGTGRVLVEALSPSNFNSNTVSSTSSTATLTSRPYVDQRGGGALKQAPSPVATYQSRPKETLVLPEPVQQSQIIPQPSLSTPSSKWLQTGAFSVLANAESLKARLYKDGFDSQIVRAGALYKVVLGPLNTSNTEEVQQRLQNFGYPVSIFKE